MGTSKGPAVHGAFVIMVARAIQRKVALGSVSPSTSIGALGGPSVV